MYLLILIELDIFNIGNRNNYKNILKLSTTHNCFISPKWSKLEMN